MSTAKTSAAPIEDLEAFASGQAGRKGAASTSYLVSVVYHAVRARLEAAIKPSNITALQFTLLEVLASHGEGITSASLSRRFFVTPQTMGETIAHLVRRGLVERVSEASDRRVLKIIVTPAGHDVIRQGEAEMKRIEADVFGILEGTELAELRALLGKSVQQIRKDGGG